MLRIERDGKLLATISHIDEAPEGWRFEGNGSQPLQWGTLRTKVAQNLLPHRHLERDRIARHKTQEFLYLISGKVMADFYDEKNEKFMTYPLVAGSLVMLYDGGHGFRCLEGDVKMIEVKTGPFVGTERDKVRF